MSFKLKPLQEIHLQPLKKCDIVDILHLCSSRLDELSNGVGGVQSAAYQDVANRYNNLKLSKTDVRHIVDAIISIMIDSVKTNTVTTNVENALKKCGIQQESVTALGELIQSKRSTIADFIKLSCDVRSYHLVDLDWRLEVRVSSRALLKQQQVLVTLKLHLRTDTSKNASHKNFKEDEVSTLSDTDNNLPKGNWCNDRKEVIVQTNLNTLAHMIHTLEDALMESRSRRIRNIRTALR